MPNLQLKAELQAYSRAAFYDDWVRDIAKTVPDYDPKKSYVRSTNKDGDAFWEEIDTTLCNEEKLEAFIREIASNRDYAQSIKIIKPNSLLDENDPTSRLPGNAFGFYDWEDKLTIVQFPALYSPDYVTIGTKKDEASGESFLTLINTPDGVTLKVNDQNKIYAESLLTKDGIILGTTISEKLALLEKDVKDLIFITQGKGGFLDPHNFGTAEPTREELHQYYTNYIIAEYLKQHPYASQEEINSYIIENPIPDQTKIKNLFDGAVWIYADYSWYNDGSEVVIAANNNGVFGTVTGSSDPFKISIDTNRQGQSLGTMTVNGLEEEFNKIVYIEKNNSTLNSAYVQTPSQSQTLIGISSNNEASTLVQRTENGFVRCSVPTLDETDKNILVNIGWVDNWFEANSATDEEIENLINETFSKKGGN